MRKFRYVVMVIVSVLVAFSTETSAEWVSRNVPDGHYVQGLAVADTLLFAATYNNGIYRSSVHGSQWMHVGPAGLAATCVVASGRGVYVGTENGLYRSSDLGATWTLSTSGLNLTSVYGLAFAGSDLFAATAGGVWFSTDAGAHWTQTALTVSTSFIAVSGTKIFAGSYKGIYRSTDHGASWSAPMLTGRYLDCLGVSDTTLFVGDVTDGLLRSSDDGATWDVVHDGFILSGGWMIPEVVSFASAGKDLYAATWDGPVYHSTDNGANWSAMSAGDPGIMDWIPCIAVSGTTVFAGTLHNGLFRSIGAGAPWTGFNAGLVKTPVMAFSVLNTDLFFSTWGGGIFRFSTKDEYPVSLDSGLTNLFVNALAIANSSLYAGTDGGGVFRSTNAGASWEAINTGLTNLTVRAFAVSDTDLFAGTDNGIFRSTDRGASWRAVSTGLTNTSVYAFAISGTYLFAGTAGGVFRSANKGASWSEVNTGLTANGKYVRTLAFSGYNLIAGTLDGVFVSNNYGANWNSSNAGNKSGLWAWSLTVYGNTVFAGMSNGVNRSTNNGASWGATTSYLPFLNQWFKALAIYDNMLIAGSYSGEIWKRPLSEMATSVEVNAETPAASGLPAEFSLGQNFPNPFNPSTTIWFSLPSRSLVSVKIFDMMGREVATLVDGELPSGEHSCRWNAEGFPSGVYFYRLQAGVFTETKHLMLLK